MSNTYAKIYVHAVFAVKYRKALLHKEWRNQMFAVMGNLAKQAGCSTILVNGVEDHAHCLLRLHPSVALATVMQTVKARSSKWLNEKGLLRRRFEWQTGYGAFSFGGRDLDILYQYVKNQEAHHDKTGFIAEYRDLLEQNNVPYDEQYIFSEPI